MLPIRALIFTLRATERSTKKKAKQNRVQNCTSFCFAPPSNESLSFKLITNSCCLPQAFLDLCRIPYLCRQLSYSVVIVHLLLSFKLSTLISICKCLASAFTMAPQGHLILISSKLFPVNSLLPHTGQQIQTLMSFTVSTPYTTSSLTIFPNG